MCCRTLAQPSDGDTIFYGSTCVGPRKNGTNVLHVELVVEESAKRLTKRPKVGKPADWYEHKAIDGEKIEVDNENEELEYEKNQGNDESEEDEDSLCSTSNVSTSGSKKVPVTNIQCTPDTTNK